ncbi:DUF3025 domain-containing protein [Ramlibacter humi]|uniref:DUF3025 domain-containing protein n=1 Tax=Ramlibacter humi TaxID=2530451 RepID=A0A4Z0BL34_9BURK|nr:DUF3025 domain-containing protein [Ramlibacter humi]
MTPDWAAPWYEGWQGAGRRIEARQAGGASLAEALNTERPAAPVRFVPQSALPEGIAYERFVFQHRECPTRENLHDFFNGLCWLHFPRAKSRLNELQALEIERDGIGSRRGPVRDAITLFDENGALLDAPAPLWDALLAREWRRLFVDLRPLWTQARLVVFGHALLEKLVQPRKDLTAHVWAEPCPSADADGWLASRLEAARLAAKPYTPLPVLGIPGWWAPNLNFSFYDDSVVFRPRRPHGGAESAPPHP